MTELVDLNLTFPDDLNNVTVDGNKIEPYEYYQYIKSKLEKQDQQKLNNELKILFEVLRKCELTGQQNLYNIIVFNINCIIRERALISLGITEYIDKDSIQNFVDNIKPKNSVKIIELSRYPREIPEKEAKLINVIRKKNIFDEFCVIFTDFTKNDYKTDEEREIVARNRDPICFGMFADDEIHKKYKRLYKICDWTDDYCDLTFDKMIDKMIEMDIKPNNGKIHEIIDTNDVLDQYKDLAHALKTTTISNKTLQNKNSQNERTFINPLSQGDLNKNINPVNPWNPFTYVKYWLDAKK